MSYKIEINADSITELSGKLLALAAQMQAPPVDPVMPEVRETTKVRGTTKAAAAKAEKPVEVAEAPVGEQSSSETSAVTPDTSSAPEQPTTPPSSTTTSDAAPEPEAPAVVALDFEKDVAPLVLRAVAAKGKPWVQEVLAQFGVERASQVPDERLPELVAIVAEAVY